MISNDFLDLLRCPLDPSHTRLEALDEFLVCTRCRLRFPVRQDIPCMLIEEAELPPGCRTIGDLPCQRPSPAAGVPS